MSRNHFSKAMFSPHFHSPHYQETKEAAVERKIENFIDLTLYKLKFKRKKKPNEIMRISREDCIRFKDFDEKYNVETSHPLAAAENKIFGDFKPWFIDNSDKFPGSQGYQNTALHWVDVMNNYFKEIPGIEHYSFVDIGAGKGRVILQTLATSPIYKDYTGIEIDPNLADIFNSNLNSTNIKIDKSVEVKCVDAREYICTNEPSVYFLFRPFDKEIWNKFITNNHEALKSAKAYFVLLHMHDYEWHSYFDTEPVLESNGLTILPT
jgi:tRNA G46 methylase TrmB